LQDDYEIEVEWRAFELHPEIPPEGMRLPDNIRRRMVGMSEHLREMAREAGLEMNMPDLVPNSRRALEAAEYAREQGKHQVFHRVVFRKLYGEGQDINSWDVLRAAAEEAGLDPDLMQQKTEQCTYQATVDRQIGEAWALGITGVPAFVFDERYVLMGAQPYDVFQQAMDRVLSEAAGRRDEATSKRTG
jgi:predicted DsbA family dithiol-disulfide isomerase